MSHCVTIVAVISVLWHTMAGCCAHHRHNPPLEFPGASTHSHAVFHAHFGTHGHDHSPLDEGTPGAPCSSDCDGDACTFTASSARTSIERDAAPAWYLQVVTSVDAPCSGHPAAAVSSIETLRGDDATGALARHLALGVLQL